MYGVHLLTLNRALLDQKACLLCQKCHDSCILNANATSTVRAMAIMGQVLIAPRAGMA